MQLRYLALTSACLAAAAPSALGAAETVPVPAFDSVELSGGGTVVLRPGSVQRVTILRGSREYSDVRVTGRGRLVIDACNERCPDRYDLHVEVQTPSISALAVSGGGDIVAQPGFPRQKSMAVAVSGGGDVDIRALSASQVTASVSGGGDLRVQPTERLIANVSGGGDIVYWGDPAVTSRTSGGGSIRKGG